MALSLCVSVCTETEAGEKAAKEEAVVENATPDYAAGLVSTQVGRDTVTQCKAIYKAIIEM